MYDKPLLYTNTSNTPSRYRNSSPYAKPLYKPKKMTIGSVTIIFNAMVDTNRISFSTSIFSSAINTSSGFALAPLALTAFAMTNRGSVSGKKHMPTTKPAAIITLIQKIHGRPSFSFSMIHSPMGSPKLGPALADATNSAMGWPAPSESPKRSAMVPATLQSATEPAVPARNWKMISMGRLRAFAQPMLMSA